MGMKHIIDWNLSAYAGRNYNDIIFIGGNRVGTGYFRNVGNTQRLGTEFALNGSLGKNGRGLRNMLTSELLLRHHRDYQVLDTPKHI